MFADAVQIERGQVVVRSPRRERPLDDVVLDMCDLHLLGVARALSGALDCFAAVIIGVMALRTSILRADFGVLRHRILSRLSSPTDDGQRMQSDFAATLESLIARHGPTGWLNWVLDFRHMLVHRGRRLTTSQFVPRSTTLYGPDGRLIPRVRVVRQLPRDPGRSDVRRSRWRTRARSRPCGNSSCPATHFMMPTISCEGRGSVGRQSFRILKESPARSSMRSIRKRGLL